jgi:hypothetical protein
MENDKLDKISELGENILVTLAEEQDVLRGAVFRTKFVLSKPYSFYYKCEQEIFKEKWENADLFVKVGKYHLAISVSDRKTDVALLVYQRRTDGYFNGNLVARGWQRCREKVTLEAILTAVIEEMSEKTSQITPETTNLLDRIQVH